MSRICLFQLNIFLVFFWAGLEPAPTFTYPIKSDWPMHISGRFGTCPYVYVSYKILLANTHFGQVWNLPLHPQYTIQSDSINAGFFKFHSYLRDSIRYIAFRENFFVTARNKIHPGRNIEIRTFL